MTSSTEHEMEEGDGEIVPPKLEVHVSRDSFSSDSFSSL